MKIFRLIIGFLFTSTALLSQDVEELNKRNISLSYDQTIENYKKLARNHSEARLIEYGLTDIGRPLHLFVISSDKIFNPAKAKEKGKAIILINNGIHPGEPDGIDASVRLAQSYLNGKEKLPANVIVCIIPVYNIDGSLKSSCCTRANQNGPLNQGFRGNARNLDLNRDFIKCDSENARSFTRIFREWDPDVLIDTHVSNGADYQYTMTLISTQHDKLGGPLGSYLKNEMTPALFSKMKAAGHEMAPYVNTTKYDAPPESGIYGFMETPRFATGYASLFNCLGFVPETHMLKPFPERVEATLKLLGIIVDFTNENHTQIIGHRKQSALQNKTKTMFPLDWEVDTSYFETIQFNGFEPEYRKSNVTQLDQLYYNKLKPFTKPVKFFDRYTPITTIQKPEFYIVPQAWSNVISLMQLNNVQMSRLGNDSIIEVETYIIDDFKTGNNPYEGHYLHHSVKVKTETRKVRYHKGDYLIPVNQECNRYIVETLEPVAPDSWFAWGFFDAVLQQKEWFSAYVFDELAEEILNNNPVLKEQFEEQQKTEAGFANSAFNQLYFIYKNSEWFEDFRRYPVGRIK